MNSSQLASTALREPVIAPVKDLAEVALPVSNGLDRVRDLIAERVFREESFGELLAATGEKVGWENILLPEWLERMLYHIPSDGESKTRAMSLHLMARGGKLFRATLILSTLRALGPVDERGPKLAAAMELIHLATLLHDDVIDRADVRRGSPSLPRLYDNAPTVLMGDHLFARAFELIAECGNLAIISSSCRATSAMCRGEIEQLQWIGRPDVPEEAYFNLIEMKTAALMASCTESAALLAGHAAERGDWYRFGLALGVLFQMTDDLLDFTADEEVLGKQTGSDAAAGKYTLPLILLRDRLGGPAAFKAFLDSGPSPKIFRDFLSKNSVLEEVRDRLRDLAETCRNQLQHLSAGHPHSAAFEPLFDLVEFVVARDH